MPNRIAFTGSVLLALVAVFGGLSSYFHWAVKVGDYDVPTMAGWATAAVFGLIALLLLRWSHS